MSRMLLGVLGTLALALTWPPRAGDGSVALTVEALEGLARKAWPVTSGVPFAEGALKDPASVRLLSGSWESPLQTEVLGRWPDGSIKWLLLDFQVDLAAGEKRTLALQYGPGVRRAAVPTALRVQDGADVTVVTGPLKLVLSKAGFRLLDSVWLDLDKDGNFSSAERVTASGGSGVVLTDAEGNTFRADGAPAEVSIEQAGPIRACVRVEGSHTGGTGRMFRYVVRLHAFRGQPFVRVFYTFVNDWPDALLARIRSLSLDVGLAGAGQGRTKGLLGGENEPHPTAPGVGSRLFQTDERTYSVDGREAGKRAPGWVDVSTPVSGVTAAVRDFWQNWPKGLAVREDGLAVEICPPFARGLYDGRPIEEDAKLYYYLHDGLYTFKVGVARTHEAGFLFHAGPGAASAGGEFQRAFSGPLLAVCEPAYVSSTKALGEFPPADPKKYFGYDASFGRTMDADRTEREKAREYGMLNFGDWYGERKVNWGNLEYDLQHGLLLQYARTGERRYYVRAEEAARHHVDVDVVHAVNAHLKNPWGSPPKVGEVWLHCLCHTGGYYEVGKVKLPVEKTYYMGHSTNFGHVWVTGDLEYYLLSGDRRALEVGLGIADAMAANCPTSYGTHIRSQGWPMILLLSAYDLTRDRKYLDAADKLWKVLQEHLDPQKGWVVQLAQDHCYHGDRRCRGNVPFMEGLMLCGLARYHRVKQAPEVLKAITIGIDQMIRECWEEESKMFRYTACPLSPKTGFGLLSAEAMAYEARLTGNREHRRILRESARAAFSRSLGRDLGKQLSQWIHFTPHALAALEEPE